MRRAIWLLLLLAIWFACGTAHAEDSGVLWRVGVCDDSYAEFGIAGKHEMYQSVFGGGGIYEVGKASPSENWCYVQPGPDDAPWAGEGEHPFEVVFELEQIPKGPLVVNVDLVDVSPTSPPTLRVRVNDAMREFDLRPGASMDSLTDQSKGREQAVAMYVAAGFLHKGRNVVNLTVTKGSWLLYDCVSLSYTSSVPHTVERLSCDPTYLFKQKPDGLKQIVYATMDLYSDQKQVKTILTSDKGWTAEQVFENVESGHRSLEVEIDPVTEEQTARLQVLAGDGTLETDCKLLPQRQWKIYMTPAAHFDYGYTALQDKAMQVHRENIDRAIDWCAKYPSFGWYLEGSFIAEDYMRNGSRPDDFVRLAKEGRIGVLGFFANELTGNCSGEGLGHTLDYYDQLRHDYGIESKCATENDVPTMIGTVPMVLNEHGIRYLSHGTNWVRAGAGHQPYPKYPYYWESPDGSRVLVWKVLGIYAEGLEVSGFDPGMDNMPDVTRRVTRLIDEYSGYKDGYPFDAFVLHSAYMDNVRSTEQLPRVIETWNSTYAYPKLIVARNWEFFEYIESNFAKDIAVVKGDGGVFWEDGVGSSARETAMNRLAERKLVTAEKLASLCGPDYCNEALGRLSDAWRNVTLYNEHTWGADCSVDLPDSKKTADQWAVKRSFSQRAAEASDELLAESFDKFCTTLSVPRDSVVVFNPSSWTRSERVCFDGPDGKRRTLFADSVPPLGYKEFSLAQSRLDAPAPGAGDTLENRYYKITFDLQTGAISSIYDKEIRRELVDRSDYLLNGYLYAEGGDRKSWNAPGGSKLSLIRQSDARLAKTTMPGRQVMTVECNAPNARRLESQTILYDECKRIDFVNHLDKEETRAVEGCYFTFPFAFQDPTVRIEIPDGVIRPNIDQYKDSCKDWFCVQDFLTMSDDKAAVVWCPVDSPLVTLKDINRGSSYDTLNLDNGMLFAYVMNNYWFTNYKARQGGDLTFRFSMTSAARADDVSAKQFGESIQSPMPAKLVSGSGGSQASLARSFVEVEGDGVVVQAVRPARFAAGVTIRLRELRGEAATVRVVPHGIAFRAAYLSNMAEDRLGDLPVVDGAIEVPCRALGLATVVLVR